MRLAATADQREDGTAQADLGELLQAEVERLPDHLRAVVVLCYWEGLTHEQAAIRLGCPLGTVRSRVARARSLLHRRLTRRGLEPVAGVMAAAFDSPAILKATATEVPTALVNSTVRLAAQLAAGGSLTQLASPFITALVQNVVWSMSMTKLKTIGICLLLISGGVYGLALAALQIDGVRRGRRDAARPSLPAKSRAQPPLKLMTAYVVEPPDMVLVELLEGLPGRPISGERLVRPDGSISLGWYGDLHVAGKTLPEIKTDLIKLLQRFLRDEDLGLLAGDQDTGDFLTDPKTGEYKRIDPRDSDRVFVDVTAYNSKHYYVQGEFNAPGKLPVTGNERVLDAIGYADGLTADADHDQVFLYRQTPSGRPVQTLKIDIDQIMLGDDLSTNYQLQHGDRLVVRRRGGDSRVSQGATTSPPTTPVAREGFSYSNRSPDRRVETMKTDGKRHDGNGDTPGSERLEKRISDLERKLDLILETLRVPTG